MCACTLQIFTNFACNLRIGPSSFSILVAKLSDHSFYENQKHDRMSDTVSDRADLQFLIKCPQVKINGPSVQRSLMKMTSKYKWKNHSNPWLDLTIFAPLNLRSRRAGPTCHKSGGQSKMPKILTSDWLIVTALTSVIGHVFTAGET